MLSSFYIKPEFLLDDNTANGTKKIYADKPHRVELRVLVSRIMDEIRSKGFIIHDGSDGPIVDSVDNIEYQHRGIGISKDRKPGYGIFKLSDLLRRRQIAKIDGLLQLSMESGRPDNIYWGMMRGYGKNPEDMRRLAKSLEVTNNIKIYFIMDP
jgi:hypothetical protein